MLGHMQKVNHFWAQIKKTQNVSLDVFAQGPSIIHYHGSNNKMSSLEL